MTTTDRLFSKTEMYVCYKSSLLLSMSSKNVSCAINPINAVKKTIELKHVFERKCIILSLKSVTNH